MPYAQGLWVGPPAEKRESPCRSGEGGEKSARIGVIAESLIEMRKEVAIARAKNKARAKLEGIAAGRMLAESSGFRARTGRGVIAAENVEQVA